MDSNGPRPYDFMRGRTDRTQRQYMNVGFVSSPYPGKTGMGDYGPTQGGEVYERPGNARYPYLLDFSRYNPYPPKLAYAQDIPLCNRQIDTLAHYPQVLGRDGDFCSVPTLSSARGGCSSCSH